MPLPRLHLVELEDLAWLPRAVRDYATDYLQFVQTRLRLHEPMLPILNDALQRSGANRIVDLCSGGAGPMLALWPDLHARHAGLRLTLTDLFPNHQAFRHAVATLGPPVDFEPGPIDARSIPPRLRGLRTIFNAFHHFRPDDAVALLRDAVAAGQPLALLEIPQRTLPMVVSMLLAPIMVLLATPFIRPFRWRRLLLTYLLPAVPFT